MVLISVLHHCHPLKGKNVRNVRVDILLQKSMQEKMRGKSTGGDDHHTGRVNTWLRGWENGGGKVRKKRERTRRKKIRSWRKDEDEE